MKPPKHMHLPSEHRPLWLHWEGHALCAHVGLPSYPGSHSHLPVEGLHEPRPEHPAGHLSTLHLSPLASASHTHLPRTHAPWPEQPPGQGGGVSQATPLHPSAQVHVPLATSHVPWLEQSTGHSLTSQDLPVHPDLHTQAPSLHQPRWEQSERCSHVISPHAFPVHPGSQSHVPSARQLPCPWQLEWHS